MAACRRVDDLAYGHLQADCLYTGISSGPNARCPVWEAFTLYLPPVVAPLAWMGGSVQFGANSSSFLLCSPPEYELPCRLRAVRLSCAAPTKSRTKAVTVHTVTLPVLRAREHG